MNLLWMIGDLAKAGVRFVVIGGLAARAHGSARITEDLDLCYDTELDNVERLAQRLAGWHAFLRGAEPGLPWVLDARALRTNPVLTLRTDHGDIDIMDRVAGVGAYPEALSNSVEVTVDDLRFQALDLPALLDSKRAAGRTRDLQQLPELEALLAMRNKAGQKP